MKLSGSCHCGKIHFEMEGDSHYPFLICHCSICTKTTGGTGGAINLGAKAKSLKVRGSEFLRCYRVKKEDGSESTHARYFCGDCGSHLWAWNAHWPELIHPVAGAIDTPLPEPPERVHMMVGSKPSWVTIPQGEQQFSEYPDFSLAQWHQRQTGFSED